MKMHWVHCRFFEYGFSWCSSGLGVQARADKLSCLSSSSRARYPGVTSCLTSVPRGGFGNTCKECISTNKNRGPRAFKTAVFSAQSRSRRNLLHSARTTPNQTVPHSRKAPSAAARVRDVSSRFAIRAPFLLMQPRPSCSAHAGPARIRNRDTNLREFLTISECEVSCRYVLVVGPLFDSVVDGLCRVRR